MEKILVNRAGYRRLRQAALLPFSQNVLERVLGNTAYAAVQIPAENLRDKVAAYAQALGLAETRGRDVVAIKDEAKKALLAALDRLVEALEQQANGDVLFLTNAGLPPRQPIRRRLPATLNAPEGLRLRAGKNSGEAVVEFETVYGARMYAVEWSAGEGSIWQNGNYASARRIVIQVPPRQDIQVRVCALGPGNRHSAWSAPSGVFVP